MTATGMRFRCNASSSWSSRFRVVARLLLHLSKQPLEVNADFEENQVGTLRIVDEQAELVLVAVDQEAMPAEGEIEPGLGCPSSTKLTTFALPKSRTWSRTISQGVIFGSLAKYREPSADRSSISFMASASLSDTCDNKLSLLCRSRMRNFLGGGCRFPRGHS